MKTPEIVLLVRHASRVRDWAKPEHEQEMANRGAARRPDTVCDYGTGGFPLTHAMAGSLCDQLEIMDVKVAKVVAGRHLVAEQTRTIFEIVLERRGLLVASGTLAGSANKPVPDSTLRASLSPGASAREAAEGVLACAGEVESRQAVLAVGHQPQLTQLAKWLTDGQLPGNVIPLGGSEIACLERPPSGGRQSYRLQWLLTNKQDPLLADLRAKIHSKYDVAKFFLGALVVGTGLSLNDAIWQSPHPLGRVLAGVGALAALVSLGFTAATLFSYDRLLMPTVFWTGADKSDRPASWNVKRPPSQAHVVLFYEMVHVWTHFFIPAIVAAFAALGLFVAVLAHRGMTELPAGWFAPPALWYGGLFGIVLLVALAYAIPTWLFKRWKPRLGFDD